jgi:hypothetical protein
MAQLSAGRSSAANQCRRLVGSGQVGLFGGWV